MKKIFLTLMLLISLFVFTSCHTETQWKNITETTLLSMRTSESITGSFFLGCGTIDSNLYYIYWTHDEIGIQPHRLGAYSSNVFVIEEDRFDGFLIYKELQPVHQSMWNLSFSDYQNRYEFHIPKGSLIREFILK